MRMIIAVLVCFAGLLTAASSFAAPYIIYDSGQTLPLPAPRRSVQATFAPPAGPADTVKRFPVRTPAMQPGRVRARRIDRPGLTHPVFIVGADPISLQWLHLHAAQLKKHHATGIAVNVENARQLQQLQKAAGGIAISPVPGQKIARQLSLSRYPVLVSKTRIEQ